jgi:hypothetical protein
MYGKLNQLLMPHPNVIVFSNYDLNGLSPDRWKKYDMDTMSEEDWAQELLDVQPAQLSPKEEEVKEDVLQCFSVCKDNYNYLDTLKSNVQPKVDYYEDAWDPDEPDYEKIDFAEWEHKELGTRFPWSV